MSKDPQDNTPENESEKKHSSWVSEARAYRKSMRNHDKEDFADIERDHEYRMLYVESDLTLNDEELEQAKQYGNTKENKETPKIQDEEEIHSELELEPQTEEEADNEEEFHAEENEEDEDNISVLQEASNKAKEFQEELRQELSFEYFVGETGTKAVGAGIFIVSFFVLLNEGVQRGIVTELHRVMIGVLLSAGLLIFAYRQQDERPGLSNIASWAGFVGFYVINYISYEIYELYNADTFLIINILFTIAILGTALRFRKFSLFCMAIVGVYYSPVVVRLHIDYLHVMLYLIFSTMLIMFIAYRQGWNFINIILYACVVIPMIHWLYDKAPATDDFALAFGVITGVSALFYGVVLFFGLQRDYKLTASEYVMYFFSLFLYLVSTLKIMHYDAGMLWSDYGLFTFSVGLFCAGVAILMYLRRPFDKILFEYTQIIALLLITFSIPLFTEVSSWNFFWVVESVILLWIAQITDLRIVRNASGGAVILAIFMLIHDWIVTYTGAFQSFFFNPAVKSAVYTVFALGLSVYLMIRNESKYKKNDTILFLTYEVYRGILAGFAVFVLWVIGNIELNYHNFTDRDHAILLNGIYNSIFFGGLWIVSKRYELDTKKFIEAVLFVLIGTYFFVDRFSVLPLRNAYLVDGTSGWGFTTHYISLFLVVGLSALIIADFQKNAPKLVEKSVWFFAPLAVSYLCFEFEHLSIIFSYTPGDDLGDLLSGVRHVGWAILLAMCAVAMVGLGIKYQLKSLRMLALVLLAGILVKFFAYDFRSLSLMQQLTSTFILGLLLMGIGNQYKKFMVLINDGQVPELADEQNTPTKDDKTSE